MQNKINKKDRNFFIFKKKHGMAQEMAKERRKKMKKKKKERKTSKLIR